MFITRGTGGPAIVTDAYTLVLPEDRPFIYVYDPQNRRLAELFVLSSVHALEGQDDTVATGTWEIEEQPGEIILSLEARSSHWARKCYRLRCTPQRFTYEIEIAGEGRLAEACYFGGYSSAHLRWGSGFFVSGHAFQQGFTPEPNTREAAYFPPVTTETVNLTGVPLPGRDDWFFTPPPFCLAFQVAGGWLSLGVEARPGAYRFTEYAYHGRAAGFHLSLAYEGHTRVSGSYRLPAIGFDFGPGVDEVLAAHLQVTAGSPAPRRTPAWWTRPIFCGWGAQCYQAAVEGGRAPDYARQALYEHFLETLEQQGIEPGTVVLDDKWQATYGNNDVDPTRWPDLRGFIRAQHARGRRVLLWLKAWDPEGLPAAECIVNAAGLPIAADPTHPAYIARLREAVRTLLSPAGYDADGFKIDFTARIPSGPGIRLHGEAWGLELMKAYLGQLYAAAKTAKPDALVIAHTPHPYLADVVDMIRLNDMNTGRDIESAMRRRARIAALACPQALIDTDNWPITDKATWRRYLDLQPQLGVPALYYAEAIDTTREPLEAADYQALRRTWSAYQTRRAGTPPALESPTPSRSPAMNESPFSIRGVVEGFYGIFYTVPERQALLHFLAQAGYNTYLYGPKKDRWHRKNWRVPYPAAQMAHFAETIALARTLGIDFAYALSPLEISYASESDFQSITTKLRAFYECGVRTFSLFMDDIDPHFQHAADAARYTSFAQAHADLGNRVYAWLQDLDPTCRLSLCPTTYHGRPPFGDYLTLLGAALHPAIDVFYTGPEICSPTLTAADARAFGEAVGRPPLIWDNYPVNDLTMQSELHLGPIVGRDPALAREIKGIFVNPMNQAEASRIALLTFGIYMANPQHYDPQAAWERALHRVAGSESYPALRLFAEHALHSCLNVTETEPLRNLVRQALTALQNGDPARSASAVETLAEYLRALDEACYHLLTAMDNLALRQELLPWIEALEHWLGMGRHALAALPAQPGDEPDPTALHALQEALQAALHHPKRIAGNALAPLAHYLLEQAERAAQSAPIPPEK